MFRLCYYYQCWFVGDYLVVRTINIIAVSTWFGWIPLRLPLWVYYKKDDRLVLCNHSILFFICTVCRTRKEIFIYVYRWLNYLTAIDNSSSVIYNINRNVTLGTSTNQLHKSKTMTTGTSLQRRKIMFLKRHPSAQLLHKSQSHFLILQTNCLCIWCLIN